jgi:branched-chain amino acid transport system permease protein
MILALVFLIPSISKFYLPGIVIKLFIFGIFAMSLNIIFGYTGLLSLGHAAFFGAGGYCAGILGTHFGITNFWAVLTISIFVSTCFAAAFGVVALRLKGIYFLLVTLALGQLLYGVVIKWRNLTGGSDGLVGIPLPDLWFFSVSMRGPSFYYLVLCVFLSCLFLMYRVIKSPFGEALQGIREDELRMETLGFNVWRHKYISFVIGGMFAGVAGVLMAYHNRFIAPSHIGIETSVLGMLMAILGGTKIIFGPVLGAAAIVLLEYYVSIYIPERWPMVLGVIFMLTIMFLRRGITPYIVLVLDKLLARLQNGRTES